MQLILLRVNSNIPVIMMGETGCGKTSLIKILADLLNVKLHILNIHAGICDKDIVSFIERITFDENIDNGGSSNKNIYDSNDKYMQTNSSDSNNKNNLKTVNSESSNSTTNSFKKIWVFLDEINTCNSLGLIAEILCNKTYLGKKLPEQMCFIAACNPYRIFTNILSNEIGLDFKSNSASRNLYENLNSIRDLNQALAYKVNSLPFSLLNYVFDFGSLSEKDELNYIESMIRKNFLDEKIKINHS